jgi:hypothetical protein
MAEVDLRYLERGASIEDRIHAQSGIAPTPEQIAFAQSCMLHGRLFWDSANGAPLETKRLLLYYGAAAFAKALVAVITGCKPEDFKPSHGLTCRPAASGLIGDFTIRALGGGGLFQEFNNVAARLNRLVDFEGSNSRILPFPTTTSDRLGGFDVRLTECLARIPGVEKAFQLSTGTEPQLLQLTVFEDFGSHYPNPRLIRVHIVGSFSGMPALISTIENVRRRAPFLSLWRLARAAVEWDHTVLEFGNASPPADELSYLIADPHSATYTVQTAQPVTPFDPFVSLPPLAGGYDTSASIAYISKIGGEYLSEFSITLAALLGLSSIVRYHPHTWTACVHRRPLGGRPVDDVLLPVIEAFLDDVELRFPQFVAKAILGR